MGLPGDHEQHTNLVVWEQTFVTRCMKEPLVENHADVCLGQWKVSLSFGSFPSTDGVTRCRCQSCLNSICAGLSMTAFTTIRVDTFSVERMTCQCLVMTKLHCLVAVAVQQ